MDITYLLVCFISMWVVLSSSDGLQTVHAPPGSNVTLTFQAPSNITVFSVYLKRYGDVKYVYYCRDEQPIKPHDQEPDLQGRVELANGLTCNASLNNFSIILKNVTQNDTHTYECVFKDSEGKSWNVTRSLIATNRDATIEDNSTIKTPNGTEKGTTSTPTTPNQNVNLSIDVIFIVVIIVFIVIFIVCNRSVFYKNISSLIHGCKRPRSDVPVSYEQCHQQPDENV